MKILATSDTHGDVKPLEELVNRYANRVEIVLHMGDYSSDLLDLQPKYPWLTMVAVAGNMDYYGDDEKVLVLNGRKVFMSHGHFRGVKRGLSSLFYYAKEQGVDVCLFGHTHFQEMFMREGILFMNPGSLVEPRGGSRAGFGLIEISDEGEISGEVLPW